MIDAGSDLYIYRAIDDVLVCCGCPLGIPGGFTGLSGGFTTTGMLSHIELHQEAGHSVPQDAIDRLIREEEEERLSNV